MTETTLEASMFSTNWPLSAEPIGGKVAQARARAGGHGRAMSDGFRLCVIVRETDAKAWEAASDRHDQMVAAAITASARFVGNTDSVGQQRMSALHGGAKPANMRDLEVARKCGSAWGRTTP